MTTKGFYDAMSSIMSDFSDRIGEQISSAMAGDKEKSRKNDQLRHEDLMRGVNALRSDTVKTQQDQLKNLETFSQNISREITVAMTATTTHTDAVNQGSLQAIFDLMANRSNVPTGNATAVPSSSTDPLSGDVPGQGSTLFEEDPRIPYADKGKKRETGSRTPRSEPLTPGPSFVPMHQMPQRGQDNGHTAPSTPLGTKGGRPPWHTPNSGHTPSPSPRWGRPPLNSPGRQPPNGGSGGDPDDGDGGGGGGRGGGGGGGDTPDPGGPPEDPGDGGPSGPPEDPPDESPDRDPRRGRTPRSGITSIPPSVRADPLVPPGESPGYDWRKLDPLHRAPTRPREVTPGEPATMSRYEAFRFRIRRGITTAIRRVVERELNPETPATFAKSVAATVPIPKYGGSDDLEEFMKWLQKLLTFVDIHQLVGEANDYNRTLTVGSAMEGAAQSWYNLNIRGPLCERPASFTDTILRISDEFLTPASATKAQQSFDRVKYSRSRGIRSFVREMQTLSSHIFLVVDEYSLRRHIVEAIPQSICDWLIEHKGLSTSTSTVVEWVEAIETRERELLEKEAYNGNLSTTRRITPSATRTNTSKGTSATHKGPSKTGTTTRPYDRRTPMGPKLPTKQRVPLEDITCHACGKKGHYRGSKECEKTLSSAHLHAMGVEPDSEEANDTPGNDETPFEGIDFDGEPDVGIADEGENEEIGLGAIVAGIQVVDEENENLDYDYEEALLGNVLVDEEEAPSDSKATTKPEEMPDRKSGVTFGGLYVEEDHPIEDEIVYMTAMKAPNNNGTSQEDKVIADDLLKSVKDNYEVWGSGAKTRPAGPTASQLKAQSAQEWASSPSVKATQKEHKPETRRMRQGLTSLIDVNGTLAYTCWDTGAELDCISPDFIRAIGVETVPKKVVLKIRLGAKGSTTLSNYDANAKLNFGNRQIERLIDVVNISRWDLILGSPFCNENKVILDYGTRTVRFGDTVIPALPLEEEEALRRGETPPRLQKKQD
jgi:hypothetical protein